MQDLLTCSDEEMARALCERTHASLYRALADAGMTHDRVSASMAMDGICMGPFSILHDAEDSVGCCLGTVVNVL